MIFILRPSTSAGIWFKRDHGKKVGIDMTSIYQASTEKQWVDTILTQENYMKMGLFFVAMIVVYINVFL